MKDKILAILEKHSTPFLECKAVHWSNWDKVAEEILIELQWDKVSGLIDEKRNLGVELNIVQPKQVIQNDFLEMFNRIKKSFCEKRNMKFTPTRVVSKPSQLHARLKDYTMDELGKVIYGAFSDNFHIESKWKWVTTEFCTRPATIEKYLV